MPSPKHILKQLERITGDLIEIGICSRPNFPKLSAKQPGIEEIGPGTGRSTSIAMKNRPYYEIYETLTKENYYNFRMLDGALVQMLYRFRDKQIIAHVLAFFPSPDLESFRKIPDEYLSDEIFANVTMQNIVPIPLRFDFDCCKDVAVDVDHPKSHFTLGQHKNCRIPVSAPLTPYHFIQFILRNFYDTKSQKYSGKLSAFEQSFDLTITDREQELLYVHVPKK